MAQHIHVALAADQNYFEGLLTAAWSIARNCSRPQTLIFHILDGGIDDASFSYLQSRLQTFNCAIERLQVNQQNHFSSFQDYRGSGKMTYARLLLPDLLPNLHQVIYADVDTLWLIDIARLWDSLSPDAVIHCLPSQHTTPAELAWFEKHNLKFEFGKRFCAGVIVMNLDKFRNEALHLKMLQAIADSNGKVPCVDETVLNAYTFWRDDRKFIEPCWQRMSFGRLEPLDRDGFVIHYAVDTPWLSIHKYHHLLTDQHLIWHRFHAEARQSTPWKSLRMSNSVFDIIACRILFLMARYLPPARALLRLALIMRGKKQNLPALNIYMLPFDMRRTDRRLLP